MNRERLSKSISMSELMQMRDSGMSNQQIADSLGVSYHTVLRYLGSTRKYQRHDKEDKPTKKSKSIQPKQPEQSQPAPIETQREPNVADTDRLYGMKLISNERIVELEGRCCQYTVRMNGKTVSMYVRGIEITLDEQQCKWVARELGNIFGMLNENQCQKLT